MCELAANSNTVVSYRHTTTKKCRLEATEGWLSARIMTSNCAVSGALRSAILK
jgi:hypothetical protein